MTTHTPTLEALYAQYDAARDAQRRGTDQGFDALMELSKAKIACARAINDRAAEMAYPALAAERDALRLRVQQMGGAISDWQIAHYRGDTRNAESRLLSILVGPNEEPDAALDPEAADREFAAYEESVARREGVALCRENADRGAK